MNEYNHITQKGLWFHCETVRSVYSSDVEVDIIALEMARKGSVNSKSMSMYSSMYGVYGSNSRIHGVYGCNGGNSAYCYENHIVEVIIVITYM